MEPKIYFLSGDILIRDMALEDAEAIAAEERAQGWNQSAQKYYERISHRDEGRCIALAAEYKGNIAGVSEFGVRSVRRKGISRNS